MKTLSQYPEEMEAMSKLALMTILTDTANLSTATTEVDRQLVSTLRNKVDGLVDWTEAAMYSDIRRAKQDVTSMAFVDIIRRDYKEWTFERGGKWGISRLLNSN